MAPGLSPQPLLPPRAQSTTRLLLTAGRSSKKPWKETGRQGGGTGSGSPLGYERRHSRQLLAESRTALPW